jgi:hypothetical protein
LIHRENSLFNAIFYSIKIDNNVIHLQGDDCGMPYTTEWEEKGIYWKYTGTVTHEDVMQSNYRFYNDARSDTVQYQILDCSEMDCFDVHDDTIESIAAFDYASSHYLKNIKVALVSSNDKIKSMFQQYIAITRKLSSTWTIRIFDDLVSARRWIGGNPFYP